MAAAPSDADFMTPSDVVHEMAFDDESPTRATHCPSYEPLAPPPAAPPPSLPPDDALSQPLPSSQHNNSTMPSSYQHSTSSKSTTSSKAAERPRVTHYYTDHDSKKRSSKRSSTTSYRGDASLRPNTGQVNSADGQALMERLDKLQVVNICTCLACILLEIPAFLGHVFLLKPARAVLGVYLIIFCLLLALFELHTPVVASGLKDNIGILFHPLGRTLYLFLLGGLCLGQAWWPFYICGGVFWLSGLETLVCYIKFPHYRRMHEEGYSQPEFHETDLWLAARNRALHYSWARPEETASLLGRNSDGQGGGGGGGRSSSSQ